MTLDRIDAKIERADSLIEQLNDAIVDYLAETPYRVVGEFNRETSDYVLRGLVTTPVPLLWGVLVGEIAHDLRSSLDNLAWQLALLTTSTPSARTQFPIALSYEEFHSKRGQAMIRNLTNDHRARIEALQPYNTVNRPEDFGPPALADLRIISNTDKHRVMNATVTRQAPEGRADFKPLIVRDAESFFDLVPFGGGSVDGAELARMTLQGVGPDPKVEMEGGFTVTVSFDNAALSIQQPSVISMLRAVLRGVREVVAEFKADLEERQGVRLN